MNYLIDSLCKIDGIEVRIICHVCYSKKTSQWDDFKIDEPVMVRDASDGEWQKRYFAGINQHGEPMAFECGATSWSNDFSIAWQECRLPTKEELSQ